MILFKISTFILANRNTGTLEFFVSSEAVINNSTVSRQIVSIREYIPKRSRLGIFEDAQ